MLAVVVEWPVGRPRSLQDVEIFVGPVVAAVFVQEVSVAALLTVGATSDDMDGDAATRELIEGREGARSQGRGNKAWAVSNEVAEPRGLGGGVGGHLGPVWLRGA